MAPPSPSFRFDDASAAPAAPAEAALELTASDGTGLRLVSLTARVVLDNPLAFTELHLVFENPEPRQLEGRFRITLPQGASISRFAMRQTSGWQEGEVVERQAARRVYEDFLHRAQDPALLEHESGNEFSARVFPIEARGRKELILSYGHELTEADAAYRLPLVGLPPLDLLDVRALVARTDASSGLSSSLGGQSLSYEVVEVKKTSWKPDMDFELKPPASLRAGLRSGSLVLVRVAPPLPTEPQPIASLLVLLDTSASRSLGHARQVATVLSLARALAAGTGPDTPLAVACFDQGVRVAFEGRAADFDETRARVIEQDAALGASDIEGALRWAATRTGVRYERALLLSDGVATAGETDGAKLREAARGLGAAGIQRLDALAAGGLRDDASLRRLVTAGLTHDGIVGDVDQPLYEIGDRLTRVTRSGLKVEVSGASWVWPPKLDAMQPGDAALVYAELPDDRPLAVHVDGQPLAIGELASCERPLLERAWVKARIERLEALRTDPATDPDVRAGLTRQMLELSVEHRVLCPLTALLVLETEQDYVRYGIDRRGLSNILTVGLGGIEVLHRTAAAPTPPPVARQAPKGGAEKAKKMESASRGGPSPEESTGAMAIRTADEGGPLGMASADASEIDTRSQASGAAYDEDDVMPRSIPSTLSGGGGAPPPPAAAAPASYEPSPEVTESRRERRSVEREEEAPRPARSMAAPGTAAPRPAPPMQASAMPSPPPAFAPPPPAPPAPMAPSPASMMSSRSMPSSWDGAPPGDTRSAPAGSPGILRRMASAVTEVLGVRAPAPAAAPPAPTMLPSLVNGAWTGPFHEVMTALLHDKNPRDALARSWAWRTSEPGNVLALVALAQSAEAAGDLTLAARACGSLIDLFPSRADLRRFAGERLEKLAERATLELAIDSYRKSVESRPDHPSGHRLLAFALLRVGRPAEAFAVLVTARARTFDSKFPGIERILTEDLGLAAAAWIRAEPARRAEIMASLARAGGQTESAPSVRFVLVWETDANDVDFHIHDAHGGHAYYASKVLSSGGELYADVTQGYGPECFTIRGRPSQRAYPYRLEAHYFRRGPMGYGMGTLQVLEHDGEGRLAFEDRPYVVMADGATVDLGVVTGPLPFPAG